jgi:transcriptional regulator with XRE-family HTH domain
MSELDPPSAAPSDGLGFEPGRLEAGIVAWRARAVAAFPAGLALRRRAELVGVAHSTYSGWMQKNGPSVEALLRFHTYTDFRIGEQVRLLFGIDEREFDVRLPLWEPRFTVEYMIENLRTMLLKSGTTAPSVFDLGEALIASCRETGDIGRWRVRQFDVPGGWHFRHIAFEAVEFMRWYGPDVGVDDDPNYGRAQELLGVEDPMVALRDWERFLSPKALALPDPPVTFEAGTKEPDRSAHWEQFRFERAELNQRLEQIKLASRTGWVGGYGYLHTPLLRHSAAATGRHIALQPLVRSVDPHHAQTVPAADDQDVRTIALLGTAAVSVSTLGNWLADALGWTWVSVEELNHRHSGQRLLLSDRDQRDLMPTVYATFADRPFPRTVLTAPLTWLQSIGANGEGGSASRMPEAESLLAGPHVLPILVRPTPDTIALWEERQTLASAEGYRPSPLNRAGRVTAMYDAWEEYLATVPGAIVAELSATLPWAGEAVMRPGAFEDAGPDSQPAFYHHPLIGDMLLRITYELGAALRSSDGINALRARGGARPGGRAQAALRGLRAARPRLGAARPVGFAPTSLVSEHETQLRAVVGHGQWVDDHHLVWDSALEFPPAKDRRPAMGALVRIRLAGKPVRSLG